ncbi:hypothetical protein [Sagittula sp.]|uniref:hypothetical protein n=1 Tax=Sagittula sp. TaxID=2038081 RepID=UPI0040582B7B
MSQYEEPGHSRHTTRKAQGNPFASGGGPNVAPRGLCSSRKLSIWQELARLVSRKPSSRPTPPLSHRRH